MEYIIEDLNEDMIDNYLNNVIGDKTTTTEFKVDLIKNFVNEVTKEKAELFILLDNAECLVIELVNRGEQYKVYINDNDCIVADSLKELGMLLNKINPNADAKELRDWIKYNKLETELSIEIVNTIFLHSSNEELRAVAETCLFKNIIGSFTKNLSDSELFQMHKNNAALRKLSSKIMKNILNKK